MPQSSGLPALVGARAAVDMREFGVAESLLARPDAGVSSLTVPRLMLEADMALAQDQPGVALDEARGAPARGGPAYRGAAARGARADGGAQVRRYSADRRPARQAQGVRRRAGRRCCARPRMPRRSTASPRCERACAHTGASFRTPTAPIPRSRAPAPTAFLSLGGDREAADIVARMPRAPLGRGARGAVRASAASATRRASSRPRSAGLPRTTRTRRCCTRSASCASASRCGARRRRTSRRASRSTTTGATA